MLMTAFVNVKRRSKDDNEEKEEEKEGKEEKEEEEEEEGKKFDSFKNICLYYLLLQPNDSTIGCNLVVIIQQ